MRWVSRIPSVEECAVAVAAAARAHGVEQADVIAHSYGTLVASMLVQTKK
jgi:pimeloyl-ACP methyl ester carboxylesterase